MAGPLMLSSIFDEYSLNARVRPSLLALFPPILTVYVTYPKLYEAATGLISLAVVFGLVTALAHFSRYRGRIAEEKLFLSWGGKPTTCILRHRDTTIDSITKQRYHEFLIRNLNEFSLPTLEQENNNPFGADYFYESAVKWLLEKTRDTKKYRLLFKENISYGFRRNCYGIRWFGVFSSLVSIAFITFNVLCGRFLNTQPNTIFSISAIVVSCFLLIWWVFVVNPNWVKDSAISYALRLLAACELTDRT